MCTTKLDMPPAEQAVPEQAFATKLQSESAVEAFRAHDSEEGAASAGTKRPRCDDADLGDWQPGMGLGSDEDSIPPARRARLAATSVLFQELLARTAIVRAHVAARRRKDLAEREISRQIAERHPLGAGDSLLRAKSVHLDLSAPPSPEMAGLSAEHCAAIALCRDKLGKLEVRDSPGRRDLEGTFAAHALLA